jgi:hypothetical protein
MRSPFPARPGSVRHRSARQQRRILGIQPDCRPRGGALRRVVCEQCACTIPARRRAGARHGRAGPRLHHQHQQHGGAGWPPDRCSVRRVESGSRGDDTRVGGGVQRARGASTGSRGGARLYGRRGPRSHGAARPDNCVRTGRAGRGDRERGCLSCFGRWELYHGQRDRGGWRPNCDLASRRALANALDIIHTPLT